MAAEAPLGAQPRPVMRIGRRSGSCRLASGERNVDLVDLVTGPLRADGALDLGGQIVVASRRRAAARRRSNSVGGEQAGAELARRQSGAPGRSRRRTAW
jgi:hypothetical protein